MQPTFAAVKKSLQARNVTIRKTGWGDYRVNVKPSAETYAGEDGAYYTTDLQDALDTGIALADREEEISR